MMRSTPEKDACLRKRLAEAVETFAGGSADAFGRKVGYANGGYIREALSAKKPVREALIDRVHGCREMENWFLTCLGESSIALSRGRDAEWPFERFSRERFEQLTEREQGVVEDAAFRVLRELELERAKRTK
jgi:hypothetical protein